MGFNLDDYEPVASRFARFIDWSKTTEHFFAVVSEMLSAPGADVCVFKTSILCDGVVVATGHAEEVRGAGNVNRTSHVENCETSSLGRCLAGFPMHNFAGSDFSKRPSREEMAKVQRMTANQSPATSNGPAMETGTDKRMPSVQVTQPMNSPTEKQFEYARKMLRKEGYPIPASFNTMTRQLMSDLIESLKNGTYQPAVNTDEDPF